MQSTPEIRQFEAETKQLLDIMIHSLYTEKEIFLRELISNASDALDKLRFNALTDSALLPDGHDPEIRIETDPDRRLLTIADNGIGMTRDEVIENIGSIARSGTQEMLEQIKKSKGSAETIEMIGRFGVGFYSAFMVADEVTLETLKAGTEEPTLWKSSADGTYSVESGSRRNQGTSVTLHLKPVDENAGIGDFTDEWTISRTVRRYSNYIAYPVRQRIKRATKGAEEGGIVGADGTTAYEDKTLNSMKPIWTLPESEVDEKEYNEFYKRLAGDWQDPSLHLRFKAEGASEYESVLFIPSEPPPDLNTFGAEFGLQLYARRVMVTERCEEVLPHFLRFVRGVVDSADIPLNISRQTLQENRHLARIRKFVTKKVLDALGKLKREDSEKYRDLWGKFGRVIKEGMSTEPAQQDRIVPLLLFESSNDPKELTSLKDYAARMKPDQTSIYYITGESRAIVANSPVIEAFIKKEYEVLFLTDPIDEFVVVGLQDFDGKPLRSVAKGDLDLGEGEAAADAKEERRAQEQRFTSLFKTLEKHLDESVKQVRLSNRLTTSPACLTVDEDGMSPQMERILRGRSEDSKAPRQKRILEVNGSHEVVEALQARFERDSEDPSIREYAELLFGYATLAEGTEIENPGPFNKALEGLMLRAVRGGTAESAQSKASG